MLQNDQNPTPERRARDRARGIELRRRLKLQVEAERRRSRQGTAEIAAALELHLDQFKTRRAMIGLLERWLTESRSAAVEEQDVDYVKALERSIEIMQASPDVETGIAVMHRQT